MEDVYDAAIETVEKQEAANGAKLSAKSNKQAPI
jgi:hypothetical protein